MNDLLNKIVYLTYHADVWYHENPRFNIPMANRLAKVVKIIDWESDEGRLIQAEREKTGKWTNLNSKEFKYVLQVYYPELKHKDKDGLKTLEVLPQKYPGSKNDMFEKLPDWLLTDLQKDEKGIFKILTKEVEGVHASKGAAKSNSKEPKSNSKPSKKK